MNKKIFSLLGICANKKVWIQTHNFPDPDAIASAYGLQCLLQNFGIDSKICYEGQIDKLSAKKIVKLCNIQLFSHEEIAEELQEDDVIILVDCQKDTGNTTDFTGEELAVIDHHPIANDTQYLYDDRRIVGACSSLIAEYFQRYDVQMNSNVATALLYGIKMDTLQFSRGVTNIDVKMFAFLHPLIDEKKLHQLESNNIEFNDLKAYGAAINNIVIYGKVGFSYVDFSCSDALVAILSDFILSLSEVDVAVIWTYRESGFKFSVRSERDHVPAGKLTNDALKLWGSGGGHATMAGGIINIDAFNKSETKEVINNQIVDRFIDIFKLDYPDLLEA